MDHTHLLAVRSQRRGGGRKAAAVSLDVRTQLPGDGCWGLSVWRDAGEASIVFRPVIGGEGDESAWFSLSDGERDEANHRRATARARAASRRYLVANRLRYMWVLTFAGDGLHGADGRRACMKLVAEFAELFRVEFGIQPYLYSPEIHPGGHGWHVNFFVQRRIGHADITRLWGHGVVWVKDWVKDSRVTTLNLTLVEAIRIGADYACKYASKDWGDDVLSEGSHRYEIAQGFKPTKVTIIVPSLRTAFARAVAYFGRPADHLWASSETPDWDGPPAWCMTWRLDGGDIDG